MEIDSKNIQKDQPNRAYIGENILRDRSRSGIASVPFIYPIYIYIYI